MATESQLERLQRQDHDVLIRVETKMDTFTAEVRATNVEFMKRFSDHEARLRVLEAASEKQTGSNRTFRWLSGLIAAGVSIVISAISVIVLYTTGKGK